ncbi:hypothetical protein D3C76_1805490 [compost metagenome]
MHLSVKGTNGESLPIDVRYTTAFGEKKFTKLLPGKNAAQSFNSRATSVPAGTVRVAAYKWQDGQGFYETYDLAYPAVTCG